MENTDREDLHKKAVQEVRENNREILLPTTLYDLFGFLSYIPTDTDKACAGERQIERVGV